MLQATGSERVIKVGGRLSRTLLSPPSQCPHGVLSTGGHSCARLLATARHGTGSLFMQPYQIEGVIIHVVKPGISVTAGHSSVLLRQMPSEQPPILAAPPPPAPAAYAAPQTPRWHPVLQTRWRACAGPSPATQHGLGRAWRKSLMAQKGRYTNDGLAIRHGMEMHHPSLLRSGQHARG